MQDAPPTHCADSGGLRLTDFIPLVRQHTENSLLSRQSALRQFLVEPIVSSLDWPDDVVEQWIFDHAEHFEADYGRIDLGNISWNLVSLRTEELVDLRTGLSDAGAIVQYSRNLDHWLGLRAEPIQSSWRQHGTWLRPPILLDQKIVDPQASGLQVVEGRNRVGTLRGRRREGLFIVDVHQVWLGLDPSS